MYGNSPQLNTQPGIQNEPSQEELAVLETLSKEIQTQLERYLTEGYFIEIQNPRFIQVYTLSGQGVMYQVQLQKNGNIDTQEESTEPTEEKQKEIMEMAQNKAKDIAAQVISVDLQTDNNAFQQAA